MRVSDNYTKITVTMGSLTVPAIETIQGIVIPSTLESQINPWMPFLIWLSRICDDRILVTSVLTSFDGKSRSGTSHPNGWAIDITFPDRLTPGVNPHFENDIYLMTHLAHFLKGPLMIAFESDHLHVEASSILQGVYRYPNSRPAFYSNDELQQPRVNADSELWKVTRTSITLIQGSNLINEQRAITDKKLDAAKLSAHIKALFSQ